MINGLKITEVNVFPVNRKNTLPGSDLVGFARIIVNDNLILSGIRINRGKNGLYIAFPQENLNTGKGYPVYFPVSAVMRKYISDAIIEKFKKMKGNK